MSKSPEAMCSKRKSYSVSFKLKVVEFAEESDIDSAHEEDFDCEPMSPGH